MTVGDRVLVREARTASSYMSANDPRVLVGLGEAAVADRVEVRWPTGVTQMLTRVAANQEILVVETGARGHPATTDIDARDLRGRTPLMNAVARGHVAVARGLLRHGADIEARDRKGATALIHAAHAGRRPEIVRALLDAGAEANAVTLDGESALMYAAAAGRVGAVSQLLDAGVDATLADARGRTARALASAAGHADVLTALDTARE